jgi:hypothetical protein
VEPGAVLVALLRQSPDVVALLGDAFYPLVAPSATPRPYVCYQLISRVPETGSSAICRLGDVARVQLSLFADDYPTLAQLTAGITGQLDYAEPEPGVYLEPDNQHDHHDKDALCLFRSLDYRVELP